MDKELLQTIECDFIEIERPLVLKELFSIGLHHVMAASEYNLRNTRFAVLKLAKGDLNVVTSMTQSAKTDFRDVIMWAGQEK